MGTLADVADIYVDMIALSLAKWLDIRGGVCVHNAYFSHVDPTMRGMADLYRRGQSPARIMRMLKN